MSNYTEQLKTFPMEKTDNELIAEFMGAVFHKLDDGLGNINERWFFVTNPNPHANASTYKSAVDLDYHKRWDWLMPVVQKIEGLYSKNFPPDFLKQLLAGNKEIIDHQYMDVIALPIASKIDEAYANVITFIRWYNTQPK